MAEAACEGQGQARGPGHAQAQARTDKGRRGVTAVSGRLTLIYTAFGNDGNPYRMDARAFAVPWAAAFLGDIAEVRQNRAPRCGAPIAGGRANGIDIC